MFICLFTFLPLLFMVLEHMVSGGDSILQKLLDNMSDIN